MLRKILAFVLIGSISIVHSPISFADSVSTELLRTKAELSETTHGEKYITQLEALIPKLSIEKLEAIKEKVSGAKEVLSGENFQETLILIAYIELLIEKEISARAMETNISDKDKQIAQDAIMELQMLMKENTLSMIDELMLAWDNQTRYEEKGDFKMDMKLDIDGVVNASGKVSLSDYIAETQKLDQTFIGKLNTVFDASANGEDMNISFWSDIDIISKDGQFYLKMKNISYSDSGEEVNLDITKYIEKLEELAKDNTYLAFEDQNAKFIYNAMSSLSKEDIKKEVIGDKFDTAFFEAYSVKEDGTYLLRPTKHLCDTGKNMMKVFDPFGGSSCTDAQYSDMLQKYLDSGHSLELEVGTKNILKWKAQEELADFNATVTWGNGKMHEIDVLVTGRGSSEGNLYTLNYVPKSHFETKLIINEYTNVDAHLLVNLTKRGNLKDIAGHLNISENDEELFTSKLTYQRGKLDITLDSNSYGSTLSCALNGELNNVYADLRWNCTIESSSLTYMIPNTQVLDINMDVEYDIRSGKNNLNMNVNALADKEKIFEMMILNTGTRKQVSEREITTPEKTKSIEDFTAEIFEETYGDLYSDESFDYDGYDYDAYSYYNEETETTMYCNTYEYNEEENYDYCVEYITEEEYFEGFEEYDYELDDFSDL